MTVDMALITKKSYTLNNTVAFRTPPYVLIIKNYGITADLMSMFSKWRSIIFAAGRDDAKQKL